MAAIDYFLKLDGISGESKDSKHKGEIEALSFSFGETQSRPSGTGGGVGAGKVKMSEFSFTARTTKASPQLFLSCAQGKHLKEATVTVRKAGGSQQEYRIIKLNDVLVSAMRSVRRGRRASRTMRSRSTSSSSRTTYKPHRGGRPLNAPVHAGWDLSKNVKI